MGVGGGGEGRGGEERGRLRVGSGAYTQHTFGSGRLSTHTGSKTNALLRVLRVLAARLLLASLQLNLRGREIICIMQSQSVHLLLQSLEKETAPLLMPCAFTAELGHLTMEQAAVGTLPLHNTLSVMCTDYSEAPRKLLFYSVNAHGHDI